VEEDTKRMEILDKLNNHYDRDALQQTQVYDRIKAMNWERKDLSNISPTGRAPEEGLDDCIEKTLKEDPGLSARETAKALNISAMTVRSI
jgi:hypothetical protein